MTFGLAAALAALTGTATVDKAKETKGFHITPVLEIRDRFERRTSKAFDKAIDDNRNDLYNRDRVGFKATYDSDWRSEFVYQYSSDPYWARTGNASTDDADLVLGNVGHKLGDGWLTAGIQRLIVGNERFLGECCEWGNFGNSWDALKFKDKSFQAFVGRLALSNKATKDARIAGADYDTVAGKTLVYYIHDRTGASPAPGPAASYDVYTIDQDYKTKFHGLSLEAEAATQLGNQGSMAIRGWMATARIGKEFSNRFSCYIDGQSISGGKSATTNMNMYTPYGNNHAYDGYMDMQGGTNKRSLALEANYKFSKTISTELMYQRIGLFDSRDAWYGKYFTPNKIGAVSFVDATGSKGRDIGQEIDLATKWRFRKDTELNVGVSEFIAGNYIKAFVPSGNANNQMWFYTQVSFKFAG